MAPEIIVSPQIVNRLDVLAREFFDTDISKDARIHALMTEFRRSLGREPGQPSKTDAVCVACVSDAVIRMKEIQELQQTSLPVAIAQRSKQVVMQLHNILFQNYATINTGNHAHGGVPDRPVPHAHPVHAPAVVPAKQQAQPLAPVKPLDPALKAFGAEIGIVTQSGAMQKPLALLQQLAKRDDHVLMLGDTGVGKDVFAKGLHAKSNRKSAPFVDVNCTQISETLIASELFGHEKGAFTGAVSRHIGKFEAATKGSLLLNEIGHMPMKLQGHLLDIFDGKDIARVGAEAGSTVHVGTRVIAATNADLEGAVANHEFRQDLYHRLARFCIVIPSLNDRGQGEKAYLADTFLRAESPDASWTLEALDLIVKHDWPGNVRELKNAVEQSAIHASLDTSHGGKQTIRAEHVLPAIESSRKLAQLLQRRSERVKRVSSGA